MRYLTLSFDDGFKASSIKTAEIYEKFGLSASINVVARGHEDDFVAPDEGQAGIPKGDFGLWRELRDRGHEVMPHGYEHKNKADMPLEEAQSLFQKCMDVFQKELPGFEAKDSIFNFPYNSSTLEFEQWLNSQVRAFRTSGGALNPLPSKTTQKLTCDSFGPDSAEDAVDQAVADLLKAPEGWAIFNLHGLDGEGWGPVASVYLEKLLDRVLSKTDIRVLPTLKVLDDGRQLSSPGCL